MNTLFNDFDKILENEEINENLKCLSINSHALANIIDKFICENSITSKTTSFKATLLFLKKISFLIFEIRNSLYSLNEIDALKKTICDVELKQFRYL